ncbi:chorismate-binding protein [Desulfovibrio psychrotolerans]|nr:chorismate-binding protein [Desulfovibrio psychrotolerans]
MRCAFSTTVSVAALPALFLRLAQDFGADMLLGGVTREGTAEPQLMWRGEPQRCIVGVDPARELVVTARTAAEEVRGFCLDVPGEALRRVLPASMGYLAYTYGLTRYGIASAKPQSLPQGHVRQYAVLLYLTPAAADDRRSYGSYGSHGSHGSQDGPNSPKTEDSPAGRGTVLVECHAAEEARHERLRALEDVCARFSVSAPDAKYAKYAKYAGDAGDGRSGGTQQAWTGASPAWKGRIARSLDAAAYMRGVEEVLECIRNGDTYQLNLSIKFMADLHGTGFDPLRLFLHLWETSPAPFHAWLNTVGGAQGQGGALRVLSTSPERFVRVRAGEVLAQPIKGTLAFGASAGAGEARALRGNAVPGGAAAGQSEGSGEWGGSWQGDYVPGMERLLTESPKESAELSMITDLIRNDISTRCEYGSVHVPRHKATFVVDSLIQMYSDVRGTLRQDATCLDLLLDAFPGGSVTGCPKRRTMRIIDRLEPHSRDLYCGSVFCVEDARTMDSSIAIRTGWYDEQAETLSFFAGSGIVADSDPEREYAETLAKAGKFLRVLEG